MRTLETSESVPPPRLHAMLDACGRRDPARLATFAAVAIAALLFFTGALDGADRRLSDAWFGFAHTAPSSRTALVTFDHDAWRYAGAPRVPRRDLAELLLKLDAAGASRILVDVTLSEPTGVADDAALERALAQLGRKVGIAATAVPSLNQSRWRRTGPMDRFTRHATRVATDFALDNDGVLRRFGIMDSGLRSLASSPAWLAGINARPDADTAANEFRIDFGIDLRGIPAFDASALLQGNTAQLAGKSVIIGGYATAAGGGIRVPRYGEITRTQAIALAAETLALGRQLHPVPSVPASVALMVLAGLIAFGCARWRAWVGAAVVLATVVSAAVLALAAQAALGLILPAAAVAAAALCGFAAARATFLVHDITRRQAARIEALNQIATRDPLTGLANRRAFEAELAAACAGSPSFALLICDLDGFKPVNDKFGHQAGDALLCAIADRLRGAADPGAVVGRLGGDEFGLLLEASSETPAIATARQVAAAIVAPFEIGGRPVQVGVSIGIALGTSPHDPDVLIATADAAMYDAKRTRSGYALGRRRAATADAPIGRAAEASRIYSRAG
jgi:diguanylate cyclase (GGDEF)-like protein